MTTTRCYEIRNKAFEYETGGTAISCAKADGAAPRHRRSERHFRNNISRRRGATNVFGLRCRSARAKRVDTLIWRISLPLLPFIHLTSIVSTFFLSQSVRINPNMSSPHRTTRRAKLAVKEERKTVLSLLQHLFASITTAHS